MPALNWEITSNTQKTTAVSVGVFLLGAVFMALTRGALSGDASQLAGTWLGVLLAGVGLASFLFLEHVLVAVDGTGRRLVVNRHTRWGSTRTVLPFAQVESISVVKIGASADGSPSYWLQIQPRGRRTLFTGRWSTDPEEIDQLAERLANQLGCPCRRGGRGGQAGAGHLLAAVLGAVTLYAFWFRVKVGPWNHTMWAGSVGPVFVLVAFATLLGLLRRFGR